MINASAQSTAYSHRTSCIQVGGGLTIFLTIAAVALIALGHLKVHVLLLPGYCIAGGAGLSGLITLIQYLGQRCVYSLSVPINTQADASTRQQPSDRSGFKEIIGLPGKMYLGRFEISPGFIPFQHVKLNPKDLERLNIADRSYVRMGDYVYTVLAAPEIRERCIGMSQIDQIHLQGIQKVPSAMLERGLITPFREAAPIAARIRLSVSPVGIAPQALLCNVSHLQRIVNEHLQGHILTHHQLLPTIYPGAPISLGLTVNGVSEGEYVTVSSDTIITLEGSDLLIASDETIPIEEATFTFQLATAVQFDDSQSIQLFPKTDDKPSDSELALLKRLGIDPSTIPEESITITPRELHDLDKLKPHLQKAIQESKPGTWFIPENIGLIPKGAFIKEGETIWFDCENIRYTMRLVSITSQQHAGPICCATVSSGIGKSRTPQAIHFLSPL